MDIHCKRCGRKLKTSSAIEKGAGKVCQKKLLEEANKPMENQIKLTEESTYEK